MKDKKQESKHFGKSVRVIIKVNRKIDLYAILLMRC